MVFQHRLFGVWASILEPRGPPNWSQVGHFGLKTLQGTPYEAVLSYMSCKNCVLEASRLDFGAPGALFGSLRAGFGRVWDASGQVLESPGPIFGLFLEDLWVPHLETSADNCGNAILPCFC